MWSDCLYSVYAGIIHLVLVHNSVRTAARRITAADTSVRRRYRHKQGWKNL